MGASNSPLQQNNLAQIINAVNSSNLPNLQSPNQTPNIIINNLNIVVNGQEFIYQKNQSSNSQQQQEMINKPQENKELNNDIQLIITSELGQLKLQVNLFDKIEDIIEKYKNKLNKDNIEKIYLYTTDNVFLNPNNILKDYYTINNPITNAKFEYKLNMNNMNISDNNKNKIKKEYKFQNMEVPHDQLEEAREKMKEKLKNGWIAVVVRSAILGLKLFYVKPNDKFKIIENEYKKIGFFCLMDLKLIQIKPLKNKILSGYHKLLLMNWHRFNIFIIINNIF